MHRHCTAVPVVLLAAVVLTAACGRSPAESQAAEDAFAALQARGMEAMGVDQYTSTHQFDALPDGGRIELQRDVDDSAGVATIRRHFGMIAETFAAGDFSTPEFVHMGEVPGAEVMIAKRERIRFVYSELPRGGELRLITSDPEALQAIHEFMVFQREEHRAGGHEHKAAAHDERHNAGMLHGRRSH